MLWKSSGIIARYLRLRKVNLETGDLFLSGKPAYHLWEFISLVGSTPSMFGEVNVEAFKHLCVVVVSCSKEFNSFDVV